MKKEISLHKKHFEEYKNMSEDYINTYEGFLESQLKEREEVTKWNDSDMIDFRHWKYQGDEYSDERKKEALKQFGTEKYDPKN